MHCLIPCKSCVPPSNQLSLAVSSFLWHVTFKGSCGWFNSKTAYFKYRDAEDWLFSTHQPEEQPDNVLLAATNTKTRSTRHLSITTLKHEKLQQLCLEVTMTDHCTQWDRERWRTTASCMCEAFLTKRDNWRFLTSYQTIKTTLGQFFFVLSKINTAYSQCKQFKTAWKTTRTLLDLLRWGQINYFKCRSSYQDNPAIWNYWHNRLYCINFIKQRRFAL